MSPGEFRRLTPYQTKIWLQAKVEGFSEDLKRDRMNQVWSAYHIANWTRAKKMPNWDTLMRKMNLAEKEPQKPADMIRIAEMLTIAHGGSDLRKEDKD